MTILDLVHGFYLALTLLVSAQAAMWTIITCRILLGLRLIGRQRSFSMRFAMAIMAGIAAMAPLTSRADELIYNYWDIAYVRSEPDNLNFRIDGYLLGLSAELTKKVFVFGSYADVSASVGGIDASEQDSSFGIGYALPLTENLDLNGRVAYLNADADVGGLKLSDHGYSVEIGLRGRFVDRLEIEGGVEYADLSEIGDNTSVGVRALWYFADRAAIGPAFSYSDSGTVYSIGLRGTWGRTSHH